MKLLTMIESKTQELSPNQKRVDEIRAHISALNQELELFSKQEEEINNTISLAQAKADQMAMNAVAVSDAISSVELELETLKLLAKDFECRATHLNGEFWSFQKNLNIFNHL